MLNPKKLLITSTLTLTILFPKMVSAEIECPSNWVKKTENSVTVCVPTEQFQTQIQAQAQSQNQNNNQSQNNNQNVNVSGGNSSSSSSSSSNATVAINTPSIPQVVYQAQTNIRELPKTGLSETALVLAGLLPAGFLLKKYAYKKHSKKPLELASSIWSERNSKY